MASVARLPAGARLGAVLVGIAVLAALAAPLLYSHDPYGQDYAALAEGPTPAHLLGTDEIGQDVFSRLLLGCRLSLVFGMLAAMVALVLGGAVGLVAVALGGVVEYLVFAVVDLVRAMPGILFALAMVAALEPGTLSVVMALGVSFAPTFARLTASAYRREAAQGYVAAARSFGAGRLRAAWRHILPNLVGPLVTQFAIILPRCIVSESVLSFIGLGVAPETPTWGRMIANGALALEDAPHAVLAPVVALSLLTLGLSLLGDAARHRLDPMRRGVAA
jgi:ABC-type dipeptide/oligopeptide/nickel transport system permease subunit